jgi:hypothetical protein
MKQSPSKRRKSGAPTVNRRRAKKAATSSRAESKPGAAGKNEAAFVLIADALSKEPGVTFNEGKGFGSRALKVNGKIFAMMTSKDQYVVKLSKERVEELVSERVGDYFDASKGKPMMEWLSVFGVPKSSVALAREAYRFVKSR